MMAVMNILKALYSFFIAIAVVVVTAGVLLSLWNLLLIIAYPSRAQELYNKARLVLCQHIIFALEFTIAGDILHTLLIPDYYTMIMLGAMVLIRAVLSYFINLEMGLMSSASPRGVDCRCKKSCNSSCL